MWTKIALQALLENVRHKNHRFEILTKSNLDGYLLQTKFVATCMKTKKEEIQHSRKWYISPYATQSEVIQTAFKAVLTAEEHEVRENFTYKGRPIFAPHYNVEKLAELCGSHSEIYDTRKKREETFLL